jgi:hypothetical protein
MDVPVKYENPLQSCSVWRWVGVAEWLHACALINKTARALLAHVARHMQQLQAGRYGTAGRPTPRQRSSCRRGAVVEEAEAAEFSGVGVVAGRPHRGKGAVGAAVEHRSHCLEPGKCRRACGEPEHLPASWAHEDALPEFACTAHCESCCWPAPAERRSRTGGPERSLRVGPGRQAGRQAGAPAPRWRSPPPSAPPKTCAHCRRCPRIL